MNEPLSEIDDKFWDKAEVKLHTPKKMTCAEHTFTQVESMQAECGKCGVGFNLTPGMDVRNGHIYNEQGLVI